MQDLVSDISDTTKTFMRDIRREQEAFQEQQRLQMDNLLEALKPINNLNQVIKDVGTLRKDTNLLMEASFKQLPQNKWDTPREINEYDHQTEVINQFRIHLGIHYKAAPSHQRDTSRVMKLRVNEQQRLQPSSED